MKRRRVTTHISTHQSLKPLTHSHLTVSPALLYRTATENTEHKRDERYHINAKMFATRQRDYTIATSCYRFVAICSFKVILVPSIDFFRKHFLERLPYESSMSWSSSKGMTYGGYIIPLPFCLHCMSPFPHIRSFLRSVVIYTRIEQ